MRRAAPAVARVPGSQTRTTQLLLSTACVVIVVAGLRSTSALLGPLMLALILSILFHPLRTVLERRFPAWAASVAVLVAAYGLILVLTLALVLSVGQLTALIPTYAAELDALVAGLGDRLVRLGLAVPESANGVPSLDVSRVLDTVTLFLSGLLSVLSDLVFVVTLLVFLAFDSAHASTWRPRRASTARTWWTRWARSRGALAATSVSLPRSA